MKRLLAVYFLSLASCACPNQVIDTCGSRKCETPPADACVDATTLRQASSAGKCRAGVCEYATFDSTCPFGCESGACKADPCASVSCHSPPSPLCVDAATLRSFGTVGQCFEAACSYAPVQTACPFGCVHGACKPDPCASFSCDAPPAPLCLSPMSLRNFSSPGQCDAGVCGYLASTTSCVVGEVCKEASCKWNDPSLSSLTVAPGSLVFSAAQTTYGVPVPPGTTTVALVATLPRPAQATMTVNGMATASGGTVNLTLVRGRATALVLVTAESGEQRLYSVVVFQIPTYVKASNLSHNFGFSVAISADGNTLAVAAWSENGGSPGINGNQAVQTAPTSGAVYVFVRTGTTWVQQAYVKPAVIERSATFGSSLALSANGDTLAVGSMYSSEPPIPEINLYVSRGTGFVFVRSGTTWTQQAKLDTPLFEHVLFFGNSVALSADGNTVAFGAARASLMPNPYDAGFWSQPWTKDHVGSVHVHVRSGATWTHQTVLRASNADSHHQFGHSVAISADGNTLVVGAHGEKSSATGVGVPAIDGSMNWAGAAYVFSRSGNAWTQSAYLKASNTGLEDGFGHDVAIAADGKTIAVVAPGEDSASRGVNGNQADNSAPGSGAAYVFVRSASTWVQEAYVKASNADSLDATLGYSIGTAFVRVALSGDGKALAISMPGEDSAASGFEGNSADNSVDGSGAAYLFVKNGSTWSQSLYLKASNPGVGDNFGFSLAMSGDARTLVVGARLEDSNATGLGGNQADNSAADTGAAYIFDL